MHKIFIKGPVGFPEDGLLLGNGDLSVSVYQKPGRIVFRLGKNDLWDTRLRLNENPAPAHIDELKQLLLSDHFRCDGLTGKVSSSHPLSDRIREICKSAPALRNYPFPCPKPAAELSVHLPGDLPEPEIRQTLFCRSGKIAVTCRWPNRRRLTLTAVIPPDENRLSLRWKISGGADELPYGGKFYGIPTPHPIFFILTRKPDVSLEEWDGNRYPGGSGALFSRKEHPYQTLPPPQYVAGKPPVLIQSFPEDRRWKEEFRMTASMHIPGFVPEVSDQFIRMVPGKGKSGSGELYLGLSLTPESSDTASRLALEGNFEKDARTAAKAARKFWSKSSAEFGDPLFDKIWNAAFHAKRCLLKAGKIPPGLFFPSTLGDYSYWHGDYHMNYNYQSIFLGDYEANHPETGDAYFDGIAPFLKLGRKIARDYYSCQGIFIQLTGFPFEAADDPFGTLPLGRMAYMTGWVAAYYYRRWELTGDLKWLAGQGYPVLRELALFYEDFLSPDEMGVYHAFPSNQAESEFSREGATDQPQVLRHAGYALRCAAAAASALNIDQESAAGWSLIADHLAEEKNGRTVPPDIPAEFAGFDGGKPLEAPEYLSPGRKWFDWYPGQAPYFLMTTLANALWDPGRDLKLLRSFLKRWTHENGLAWAMSISNYGHPGAWTETLGFAGVLAALMLGKKDGALDFFPGGLPSASFRNLRAPEGLFCSAEKINGKVSFLSLRSPSKQTVRVFSPWKTVRLQSGKKIRMLSRDSEGRIEFECLPGREYRLTGKKTFPSS